jgi:hypothetical protein
LSGERSGPSHELQAIPGVLSHREPVFQRSGVRRPDESVGLLSVWRNLTEKKWKGPRKADALHVGRRCTRRQAVRAAGFLGSAATRAEGNGCSSYIVKACWRRPGRPGGT